MIDLIIDKVGEHNYSAQRVMFNAKQQILGLEMLLNAAKNGDVAGFEDVQRQLSEQSTH